MTTAFSPGHITCFFQPVSSYNPLSAGSRGAGIRINLGSTVMVKPASGKPITKINGNIVEGEIVRHVARLLDPDQEYDINIKHDLPVGQGFGMSAADAVATSLCVCRLTGKDMAEGYRAAHMAELSEGGGRGDVAGIMSRCSQPLRTVAGLPPFGKVEDTFVSVDKLTLFTVGPQIETKSILSDRKIMAKIREAGAVATDEYLNNLSLKSLFEISNRFSEDSGLRTSEINNAIHVLEEAGYRAAMCMLGNSLFTTAPKDAVKEIIGDVWAVSCSATVEEARVTRIK